MIDRRFRAAARVILCCGHNQLAIDWGRQFHTESVDFVMRNNPDGLVSFGDVDALAEKINQAL